MYGEFFNSSDVVFVMALAEPIKKGGRYPKKEQIERRLLVHQLHFNEKKSAVQISKDLNINRNTINEDIKFWYSQLSNQSEIFDLNSKMIQHIQRIEIRRNSLVEDLDSVDSFEKKMRIERLISELDDKLMQFYSKAIFSGKHTLPASLKPAEIRDKELKKIIRGLVISDEVVNEDFVFSENSIKCQIIVETKCDEEYANQVIEKMKKEGLMITEVPSSLELEENNEKYIRPRYILDVFALMRGYISEEEFENIQKQKEEMKKENKNEEVSKLFKKRNKL